MAMRGQKRHLVTLENPGPAVADTDGGYTQEWTELTPRHLYADIRPATARDLERVFAGTVQSTASHLVTTDYHGGVTTKTRLHFGARIFQVTGLQNPEERNIELIMACEEVIA